MYYAFWLTYIPWLQPLFAEIGRFVAYTRRAIRRAAEECAAAGANGAAGADGAGDDEAAAAAQRLTPAACEAADGAPARGPGEDVLQREASTEGVASTSRVTSGPAACLSASDEDTPKVQLCPATKYTCCHYNAEKGLQSGGNIWASLQRPTAPHCLHAFISWQECRQALGGCHMLSVLLQYPASPVSAVWQLEPSMQT